MDKKITRFSAVRALECAAEEAGVSLPALKTADISIDPDGLYRIAFLDDWMAYQCYIDCVTGEVRGFYSEPLEEP